MANKVHTKSVTETLTVLTGSTIIPIGVKVSQCVSTITDQRTARKRKLVMNALEQRLKHFRKDEKTLEIQTDLISVDQDTNFDNNTIIYARAVTASHTDKPKLIMNQSTAFSIQVALGTAITPSAFVQDSGRRSETGARSARVRAGTMDTTVGQRDGLERVRRRVRARIMRS